MISVVIPFIDQWEFTKRCLEVLAKNTTRETEILLIDNGSNDPCRTKAKEVVANSNLRINYLYNKQNIGVLKTFEQGLKKTKGDIIFFIHNDVLIHELGWNERVEQAFEENNLGMGGLLGARGVAPDGGRIGVMSHMLGKEWGKTEVQPAAAHHGEVMTGVAPAVVFDGVGLMFKREALQDIAENTDIFEDWRAPHHFYDRIITLKIVDRGWRAAVIGIQFDHYSGATANSSEKYNDLAKEWCEKHGHPQNGGWDNTIYWIAEKQWRDEYAHRLDLFVEADWSLRWRNP